MFSRGSITLGRFRGAPIRIHWSVLIGILVFSGFSFDPVAWLAVIAMIILHELGHAVLVHHFGYQIVAVEVHGFGGHCQWAGDPTRAEVAAIAWGGVLAQGALWIAATIVHLVIGHPSSHVLATVLAVFTSTNAYSILLNLMPIPPLDGSKAWELPAIWWGGRTELADYLRKRESRSREATRERQAAKRRDAERRTREATEKELRDLEEREKDDAPMPDAVKEALDRLQQEAAREKSKKGENGKGS